LLDDLLTLELIYVSDKNAALFDSISAPESKTDIEQVSEYHSD
jgi:hypothetical protein